MNYLYIETRVSNRPIEELAVEEYFGLNPEMVKEDTFIHGTDYGHLVALLVMFKEKYFKPLPASTVLTDEEIRKKSIEYTMDLDAPIEVRMTAKQCVADALKFARSFYEPLLSAKPVLTDVQTEILGVDNPYSLREVLKLLIDGAEHLLHVNSYDGDDYEEIGISVKRAIEIINYMDTHDLFSAKPSEIEAVEFAEWVGKEGWNYNDVKNIWYSDYLGKVNKTTAELYKLFKQDK